ncbi:MAG: hypothetical protein ACRDAI_04195 [Candidatus Rhabdochlamydia sp.]
MKNLNKNMMKNLSFPDFEVKKMEFFPQEKILKIFVEGAWLEMNGGTKLGPGILFFKEWKSLSINRFNPTSEQWFPIPEIPAESLRDLCEVKFSDSAISLCGFGNRTGQWIEWKMENAKMHAEFDD